MNAKLLLTCSAAVVLCVGAVRADDPQGEPPPQPPRAEQPAVEQPAVQPPPVDVYQGQQLTLDLFGTYADRDRQGDSGNHWGGGLGINYFLNRFVGIGADSYLEEWKWPYRVNGSAILRLPLQSTGPGFALYGIGGGGRQFKDVPQYTWHAGGGVEYRCKHHSGLFADIRRVFPDKTADYTLVRAGIRFVF